MIYLPYHTSAVGPLVLSHIRTKQGALVCLFSSTSEYRSLRSDSYKNNWQYHTVVMLKDVNLGLDFFTIQNVPLNKLANILVLELLQWFFSVERLNNRGPDPAVWKQGGAERRLSQSHNYNHTECRPLLEFVNALQPPSPTVVAFWGTALVWCSSSFAVVGLSNPKGCFMWHLAFTKTGIAGFVQSCQR